MISNIEQVSYIWDREMVVWHTHTHFRALAHARCTHFCTDVSMKCMTLFSVLRCVCLIHYVKCVIWCDFSLLLLLWSNPEFIFVPVLRCKQYTRRWSPSNVGVSINESSDVRKKWKWNSVKLIFELSSRWWPLSKKVIVSFLKLWSKKQNKNKFNILILYCLEKIDFW